MSLHGHARGWTMQVCRHCGWENPEIAAFCTNCGTALGRGRSTGPRFRALGIGAGDDLDASSVDAEWPSAASGSLGRTVVDLPARPLGVAPSEPHRPQLDRRADALVGPPIADNAPLGRRTTAPALMPDEVEISVDAGPGFADDDEPIDETAPRLPIEDAYDVEPAAVGASSSAPTAEAPAPANAAQPEPLPAPDRSPTPDVEPEAVLDSPTSTEAVASPEPEAVEPVAAAAPPALEDAPTIEMPIPGGPAAPAAVQATDPAPPPEPEPEPEHDASADSLEQDGFDAFVDPAERASSMEEPSFSVDPAERSEDIEIESADGFVADDEDEFDEIHIAPPDEPAAVAGSIEDSFDELELSTSDLHAVDFDDEPEALATGDVSSTSPGLRAVPPPLPVTRFVLRPFSRLLDARRVVGVGVKPVLVGRGEADVRLTDDVYVSPRHARFSVIDDRLQVEDLGSLNGVWRRVRVEVLLRADDEVLIGQQVLRIDAAAARPAGLLDDEGTQRIGASPDRSGYRVTQLAADGAPLDVFHLPRAGCRIGRRLGDLVFTDDTHMSGTHAILVPRDGKVLLRDLASRNGTWVRVNGRCGLEVGDAVMIGRTVWRVGEPVRPDR